MSLSAIDRRIAAGHLAVVHPGVYRHGDMVLDRAGHRLAASLAVPSGALSSTSAGEMWGLRRIPDRGVVLSVTNDRSPELDEVKIHRVTALEATDWITWDDGSKVTSAARTAFDLAGTLHPDALGSVIEQLMHERKCTFDDLADVGRRLCTRGRRGSGVFREVLDARPVGAAPVESDLEWRVDQALRAAGVTGLVRQYAMTLHGVGSIRIDLAIPELRLAIEVDHHRWHLGSESADRDRYRDRKLAALGWHVIRLTDFDVRHRLEGAVTDVLQAITRRRSSLDR